MNPTPHFAELDSEKLTGLVNLYNLESYLFDTVSRSFEREGTLSSYDFFAIVIWKANRTKTKIKEGLKASGNEVGALMQEVSRGETLKAKVEALTRVWGIGLAMASAILTVCYPEQFTILDTRAWKTLQGKPVPDLPERFPATSEEYIQYCEACRKFAAERHLSLRNLDRALWAKDWQDSLLTFIKELPH
jgi:hypothetical protein